jgi:hypothetical protein
MAEATGATMNEPNIPNDAEYPVRPSLFALHYCKALFESDAIKICGRDAVLFVAFIVTVEDKLYYKAAPRFWREELMRRIGYRSPKDLSRVRKRAINAGLILYTKGSRAITSSYWVLVPDWLEPFLRSQKGTQNAVDVPETERNKSAKRSQKGTQSGTQSGTHSTPNPKPQIQPRNKSAKVSIDRPNEVQEQIWSDWLTVRKAKGSGPVTETALKAIRREAAKAGIEFPRAMEIAAERGWQSFQADWIETSSTHQQTGRPKR